MVTITNQMLYNALKAEFSKTKITEVTAENAYSYFADLLSQQEEFSDELIDKAASVAFDAVNDCYAESCGIPSQISYSEENVEDLFTMESQDQFATWVGRAAAHVGGVLKGAKNAVKYIGRSGSYIRDMNDMSKSKSDDRRAEKRHGSGFWGRAVAGHESYVNRRAKIGRHVYRSTRSNEYWRDKGKNEGKEDQQKQKSFIGRFKDSNGSFMGMGKKGIGVGKWAKQNKLQAGVAAGAATAAVAGGAYLTYKAIQKKKAKAKAEAEAQNKPAK